MSGTAVAVGLVLAGSGASGANGRTGAAVAAVSNHALYARGVELLVNNSRLFLRDCFGKVSHSID